MYSYCCATNLQSSGMNNGLGSSNQISLNGTNSSRELNTYIPVDGINSHDNRSSRHSNMMQSINSQQNQFDLQQNSDVIQLQLLKQNADQLFQNRFDSVQAAKPNSGSQKQIEQLLTPQISEKCLQTLQNQEQNLSQDEDKIKQQQQYFSFQKNEELKQANNSKYFMQKSQQNSNQSSVNSQRFQSKPLNDQPLSIEDLIINSASTSPHLNQNKINQQQLHQNYMVSNLNQQQHSKNTLQSSIQNDQLYNLIESQQNILSDTQFRNIDNIVDDHFIETSQTLQNNRGFIHEGILNQNIQQVSQQPLLENNYINETFTMNNDNDSSSIINFRQITQESQNQQQSQTKLLKDQLKVHQRNKGRNNRLKQYNSGGDQQQNLLNIEVGSSGLQQVQLSQNSHMNQTSQLVSIPSNRLNIHQSNSNNTPASHNQQQIIQQQTVSNTQDYEVQSSSIDEMSKYSISQRNLKVQQNQENMLRQQQVYRNEEFQEDVYEEEGSKSPKFKENSSNRKNIMSGMNFADKMRSNNSSSGILYNKIPCNQLNSSSQYGNTFSNEQQEIYIRNYYEELKKSGFQQLQQIPSSIQQQNLNFNLEQIQQNLHLINKLDVFANQRQVSDEEDSDDGENHNESLEELVTNSDDENQTDLQKSKSKEKQISPYKDQNQYVDGFGLESFHENSFQQSVKKKSHNQSLSFQLNGDKEGLDLKNQYEDEQENSQNRDDSSDMSQTQNLTKVLQNEERLSLAHASRLHQEASKVHTHEFQDQISMSPGFYTFSGIRLKEESDTSNLYNNMNNNLMRLVDPTTSITTMGTSPHENQQTPSYEQLNMLINETIEQRSPILKQQDVSSQIISPQTADQIQNLFLMYNKKVQQNNQNPITSFDLQDDYNQTVNQLYLNSDDEQTIKARVLIDAIFDLELKREALIRSKTLHQINVEKSVFYEIDYMTDHALQDILALNESQVDNLVVKPTLTLNDLIKASLSIKLNNDMDKNYGDYQDYQSLIHKKLRFLIFAVNQFQLYKETLNDLFKDESREASKQLKRIKQFCERYRQKTPLLIRKQPNVKSINQLKDSPSKKLYLLQNSGKRSRSISKSQNNLNKSERQLTHKFGLQKEDNIVKQNISQIEQNQLLSALNQSKNKLIQDSSSQKDINTYPRDLQQISEEKYFKLVSDFSQSNFSYPSNSQTLKTAQFFQQQNKTVPVTPKIASSNEIGKSKQLKGMMKQLSRGNGINIQQQLKNKNLSEKIIKSIISN